MSLNVETHSPASSITQSEKVDIPAGQGESSLPDKTLQNLDDEWEHDPANARNWSWKKKWTATAIVNAQAPPTPPHQI